MKVMNKKDFIKFHRNRIENDYQIKYFRAKADLEIAEKLYNEMPLSLTAKIEYRKSLENFSKISLEILEKLMEENSDVLACLK